MKINKKLLNIITIALALLVILSLAVSGLNLRRESTDLENVNIENTIIPEQAEAKALPDEKNNDEENQSDEKDKEDEEKEDKDNSPVEENKESKIVDSDFIKSDDSTGDNGSGTGDNGGGEENKPKPTSTPEPTKGPTPTPGPKQILVTDLSDRIVNSTEFSFYAYSDREDVKVQVVMKNAETRTNGTILSSGDGQNYYTDLSKKTYQGTSGRNVFEVNVFMNEGGQWVLHDEHSIRADVIYVPDGPTKDEDNPTIEIDPAFPDKTKVNNPTLRVRAFNYKGQSIPKSRISVTYRNLKTGKTYTPNIATDSQDGWYEYQLWFDQPNVGDEETYLITVSANDLNRNGEYVSAVLTREVVYQYTEEDEIVGTAYIYLDASTLGLGMLDSYEYKIVQGKPASYAVCEMLEECGYEYTFGGTKDVGFYLRSIARGGIGDAVYIPDRLTKLLDRDGVAPTGQASSYSISEFDYRQGSGFMYSVGGPYAGKGLSEYQLMDGDTLFLRFTLCWGKDIGGYGASGGSYGMFDHYCHYWIGGAELGACEFDPAEEKVTKEPTCEENGEKSKGACKLCGEPSEEIEEIPALGHDWMEFNRVEPMPGVDGYVEYICRRAGCKAEPKVEILPALPDDPTPEPTIEPTPEPEPEPETGDESAGFARVILARVLNFNIYKGFGLFR